jgi:hypothetical protein
MSISAKTGTRCFFQALEKWRRNFPNIGKLGLALLLMPVSVEAGDHYSPLGIYANVTPSSGRWW